MAKTKRAPAAPQWFRGDGYDAAATLDAGDWLLNLTLRRWLRDERNPATEDALRSAGPVLKRGDPAQVKAMHLADVHRWISVFKGDEWDGDPYTPKAEADQRPSLPPDVWEALQHGRVRDGITPLRVAELYGFERMLPAEIRAAGARCESGDYLGQYPPAFSGTLDDAFGEAPKKQMVSGRFITVDLRLPDDVLIADFANYLKRERHRLAAMGGRQPHREAARIKAKPASRLCATLASLRLLPYLDLVRWASREPKKSAGALLTDAGLMALAGVDSSRREELHRYARIAERQMELHALFARLDRSAVLRPARGKG